MENEIVYLDTYCEGGYSYDEYVDWCHDMEIEPAEEQSEEYWRWIAQQIEDDVECFFENLKYANDVNGECVVSGTLGLWDGRHEIEPKEFDTLEKAIKACWSNADYVTITGKDGVIYVEAMHHDGTNRFEIRKKDGEYPKYLY